MVIRALALCLVATLSGCGDDEDASYSDTVVFPTKTDTWSSALAGVLEVGGVIEGTRTASGSTRVVRVKLRFGGTGLNCAPKLGVSADFGGRVETRELAPVQGAQEDTATLTFGSNVTGAAKLRVTLTESDCGPIGISLTESTVTFTS
jgi:hypothetical protein